MAVDPIPVLRRADANGLSKALLFIAQALNLGAAPINHNMGSNVPPSYVYYPFRSYSTTVENLPAPGAAGLGARAIVTDASLPHGETVGATVLPGGNSIVPVYCDGASWLVG